MGEYSATVLPVCASNIQVIGARTNDLPAHRRPGSTTCCPLAPGIVGLSSEPVSTNAAFQVVDFLNLSFSELCPVSPAPGEWSSRPRARLTEPSQKPSTGIAEVRFCANLRISKETHVRHDHTA